MEAKPEVGLGVSHRLYLVVVILFFSSVFAFIFMGK